MRGMVPLKNGTSVWWKSLGRNKRCITLNLKSPRGRELFLELCRMSDVVIENFRPGVLEQLGLAWETLHEVNPNLILLRISGYGQTGPYRDRPGFGRVAEAFSGAQYITGEPDRAPMTSGYSLVDMVSGLMGAYAVMLALHARQTHGSGGQVIDLGLYESLFRLVDFPVPIYDQLGVIVERLGNGHPTAAPINTYRTRDGRWVTVSAPIDRAARRLLEAIGGTELASDPRFLTNESRVKHRESLDALIRQWFADHTFDEVQACFETSGVAYSKVYSAADIAADAHYAARENIVEMPDEEFGSVRIPGVVPKLLGTPGAIRWTGPRKGEHNEEVYSGLLGLSPADLEELRQKGVI